MDRNERRELLDCLERLRVGEAEYCSHGTALFLLGFLPEPPSRLTLVGPTRRRPRRLAGRELVFVHLPRERCQPVQSLELEGHHLVVSTLEKTLIDLLAYLDLAPDLESLARLAVTLPFSPEIVIRLARQTSDSVLKRAAWLMAFGGRIVHQAIPWSAMSATPVRLDPREGEGEILWDGRFRLKFPAWLLERFPKTPVAGCPREEGSPAPAAARGRVREEPVADAAEWLELRRFPAFLEQVRRSKRLPIRGDPTARSGRFLEEFARSFWEKVPTRQLDRYLAGHADALRHGPAETFLPGVAPRWLHRWLDGRIAVSPPLSLVPRRPELARWAARNLAAPAIDRFESALLLGHRLGLGSAVLEAIEPRAYALVDAARETTLLLIARDRLEEGFLLSPRLCVALARILVRAGDPEEALTLLGRHQEAARAAGVAAAAGELGYAMGSVRRRLGLFDEALADLQEARSCFSEAGDGRGLMMVESALGNLHLSRGDPTMARAHLQAALNAAPSRGRREVRAVLAISLAQADYDSGRFRRCLAGLDRAETLLGRGPRGGPTSNLLVMRAKTHLELGMMEPAMTDLQRARRLPGHAARPGFLGSLRALLAWCCQLMGQDAAARSWWAGVEAVEAGEHEPRGRFALAMLRAMSTRFAGDQTSALDRYRGLLTDSPRLPLSPVERGGIWLGIGVVESCLNLPAATDSLRQARDTLRPVHAHPQAHQANIVSFALDERFRRETSLDLRTEVTAVLASGVFDPFWAWYATELLGCEGTAPRQFVLAHLRRTPGAMLNALGERFPGLAALRRLLQEEAPVGGAGVTCLGHAGTRHLSPAAYRQWRTRIPRESLVFDGPTGSLTSGGRRVRLPPGSLPHRIFANLLAAWPGEVRTEQLYAAVWGSAFDPEFDPPAVKAALFRLRQLVDPVLPGRTVRLVSTGSKWGALRLILPSRWEAVL